MGSLFLIMKTILCYGWYNHGNLGDELFKEAFAHLFPNYNFIYTDHFNLENIEKADAVFFGGGSFLDQEVFIPKDREVVWSNLLNKTILYIGVGIETDFHKDHAELFTRASLIAPRTKNNRFHSGIYPILEIPDLVYSLKNLRSKQKQNTNFRSVLVLPNALVVPNHADPHWMHSAWDHFKTEFSQFLDYLIDTKYQIDFGNFCFDDKFHDNFATYSIISSMKNRSVKIIKQFTTGYEFSDYGTIITQRYHGKVLADMANVPCLSISHHDKLKSNNSISYYELSKNKLIEEFHNLRTVPTESKIKYYLFEHLVQKVNDILK